MRKMNAKIEPKISLSLASLIASSTRKLPAPAAVRSMAFLGAAPAGVERPAPNHSNRFVIDEDAMATGIAMYAAMALS